MRPMMGISFPEIVGGFEVGHTPSISVTAAAAAIAASSVIARAAQRGTQEHDSLQLGLSKDRTALNPIGLRCTKRRMLALAKPNDTPELAYDKRAMCIQSLTIGLALTSTHFQTPFATQVNPSQWPPPTLSHYLVSISMHQTLSAHFPAGADLETLTFELEDVHDDQLDCES